MNIVLNGQNKDIPENSTLAQLVTSLNLKASRIAVEINGDIKSYVSCEGQLLCSGDKIEIVSFVGGG